jgi:hypothetical protein
MDYRVSVAGSPGIAGRSTRINGRFATIHSIFHILRRLRRLPAQGAANPEMMNNIMHTMKEHKITEVEYGQHHLETAQSARPAHEVYFWKRAWLPILLQFKTGDHAEDIYDPLDPADTTLRSG